MRSASLVTQSGLGSRGVRPHVSHRLVEACCAILSSRQEVVELRVQARVELVLANHVLELGSGALELRAIALAGTPQQQSVLEAQRGAAESAQQLGDAFEHGQ